MSSLASALQIPMTLHRLYQWKVFFFYLFYYTRRTDVITLIQWNACPPIGLAFHYLQPYPLYRILDCHFVPFWSYIQNVDKGNPSLPEFYAHKIFWPITCHLSPASAFCNDILKRRKNYFQDIDLSISTSYVICILIDIWSIEEMHLHNGCTYTDINVWLRNLL